MTLLLFRIISLSLLLLISGASHATPLKFDLGDDEAPPPLEELTKPRECTIAYLINDTSTNETYVERMQIAPDKDAVAARGKLPCPTAIAPKIANRALDGCRERTGSPKSCVFADMSRGFDSAPLLTNTSENNSRCASDLATQIAIACWNAGGLAVCNVACGDGKQAAMLAARNRCEVKHQKVCGITGSAQILAR